MILNFTNVTDHIQSDSLIGVPIQRMAIIDAGVEQRSIDNIDSYDKENGRINFKNNLSNNSIPTIVIVSTI